MTPTPLLFLGDSPTLQTGLGRIGRDLACFASTLPEFRVGFLGRGGIASRKLPFAQYTFDEGQWGQHCAAHVWRDFAGDQPGILFCIWDPGRLWWVPQLEGNIRKWLYCPIDGTSPQGTMPRNVTGTLRTFDRVLGYGAWGAGVLERTLERPAGSVDWIPHGFDGDKFVPREKQAARIAMNAPEGMTVIGTLMTNQARKDWGLACAAMARLRQSVPKLRWWCHVDVLQRVWDLPALFDEFGLGDIVHVTLTGSMNAVELSYYYSACDATILPSLGEGFGFPIVESLACGVPVIHGNYAGGVELVPQASWLVEPASWRIDPVQNVLRPVFEPADWAEAVSRVLAERPSIEQCTNAVSHLRWSSITAPNGGLWSSCWRKWLLEGLC